MRKLLGILVYTVLFALGAQAQVSVSGTVTDSNGDGLAGATVRQQGSSTNATITNVDGNFTLTVSELPATLIGSYIGFDPVNMTVSSAGESVNIILDSSSALLDEVVVTGLASSVKRSNLANSVAVVKAEDLTGTATQTTMDGALYGKFNGADLRSNSGAPGGGMSVRLRGVTSIFADQQPLYIIDGVYVDNKTISLGNNSISAAAGGGNTSTNQDDASNRIADIDPEDIETIEILKGASAAAIYGSRAAGGVVIINTKKGKAGQSKITIKQNIGISRPLRLLGTREFDAAKVETVFNASQRALFEQNGDIDYEDLLFNNSPLLATSRLEFSGGSDNTQYFVGGTFNEENGLVDNTGYVKKAVRLNINHDINDRIHLDLSSNYINSTSDRGFFNNSNNNRTIGYARAFTRPGEDLRPNENGVYPAGGAGSNLLETIALTTNEEKSKRFLAGITALVDVFENDKSNLRLQLRGGLDQYTLGTRSIFPQALSYFRADPNSENGISVKGNTVNQNTNMSAFLVHTFFPNEKINFRTQAGVTQEDFNLNTILVQAQNLNGSQTNVDQAASNTISETIQPQRDKGFFVQEEINYMDRIIVTGGLRGDKSTNNGDADKFFYYPKGNIAVNLHQFDFFNSTLFNQLKVRAAYGESGRFANFNDRFNPYLGTFVGNNSGFQTSGRRGNPAIGPETQSELEFGTDIGILDGRVTLDASYYIKTIDDLLLAAGLPSSTGFTSEIINGGKLRNNGLELGLTADVMGDSSPISWSTNVNWWTNSSEVQELAVPAFTTGGFASSLGTFLIEEGQSATQIVGTFLASDCQTSDCSDLDPNGDGQRVYGDSEADFNMSWNNNLTYKNFDLSFLWHWKEGGDGINLSTLLYDLGNITWDYDEFGEDPSGQLNNGDYRKSVAFASAEPWVEDAGFIRLREVGLFYRIPSDVINDIARIRVGFTGRNLINSFDYNSYDPEVSNFGNNVLGNNVEVTPFPSAKTFTFQIKGTF